MRKTVLVLAAIVMLSLAAATSKATTILLGQCIEFAPCWTGPGPTAWSDALSGADLASLGLGASVPLVAAQTSKFFTRLGVTTFVFDTTTGTVTETLPEFSGSFHTDPCHFCEIDIVGTFTIPANALDGTISGTFGNSTKLTSAGVNVCLNSGVPCAATAIPEPNGLMLLGSSLCGLLICRRRCTR